MLAEASLTAQGPGRATDPGSSAPTPWARQHLARAPPPRGKQTVPPPPRRPRGRRRSGPPTSVLLLPHPSSEPVCFLPCPEVQVLAHRLLPGRTRVRRQPGRKRSDARRLRSLLRGVSFVAAQLAPSQGALSPCSPAPHRGVAGGHRAGLPAPHVQAQGGVETAGWGSLELGPVGLALAAVGPSLLTTCAGWPVRSGWPLCPSRALPLRRCRRRGSTAPRRTPVRPQPGTGLQGVGRDSTPLRERVHGPAVRSGLRSQFVARKLSTSFVYSP